MALKDEKLTEPIKLLVGETLFLDLSRLAALDNRSVADYVRHQMTLLVYGRVQKVRPHSEKG